MEYVDGEDLKTLLRRIGRLPPDKGIDIAQQLCAGLAAAHAKNVVHRDLKPANIMVDGQGQVRITDFGLAKSADSSGGAVVGTPAYMAPEQLLDGTTNVRTDLYSLGLVLYEVFTGEPVFKAQSILALRAQHRESDRIYPSNFASDIDPLVESALQSCLEKDPRDRPTSARQLAANLPGGEPLATMLAAGDTPSPEIVAATGGEGAIGQRTGSVLLALTLVCLLFCWLGSDKSVIDQLDLRLHPEVLADHARQIVETFGYEQNPADSAWGFHVGTQRPRNLDSGRTSKPRHVLEFWYRQSASALHPQLFHSAGRRNLGNVTYDNPPPIKAGMINLQLDSEGRLKEFSATPPMNDVAPSKASIPFPWEQTFRDQLDNRLSFDVTKLVRSEPLWVPRFGYDDRVAWRTQDDQNPLHIEAASYRGRPVSLRIGAPATSPAIDPDQRRHRLSVLGISLMACSAIVACFNLRSGRGDRKGARRLAIFMFASNLLLFALVGQHSLSTFAPLLQKAIAWGLFSALEMWLFYIALEPFVRRFWPAQPHRLVPTVVRQISRPPRRASCLGRGVIGNGGQANQATEYDCFCIFWTRAIGDVTDHHVAPARDGILSG